MKKLYSFICILFAVTIITTATWAGEKTYSDMSFDISTPVDSSDDSSDVYARLLVIDPLGNKTGYDPSIGAAVSQIHQSDYFEERIGDIQTGEPGLEGYNILIGDPIAGEYILQVIGNRAHMEISGYDLTTGEYTYKATGERPSQYHLSIYLSDNSGKSQRLNFKGLTAPGIISEFKITYDPTPGFIPKVEKIVTIEDAKKDVNIAYDLGAIDNVGIKQSLLAKLDGAEKAIQRGNKRTAENQLNAFINEVNAQKEKHIKGEAAKILLEDAQYIMDNL